MSNYYDENGNLVTEDGDIPTLPEPADRKVKVELKDGTTENLATVDENGNLQVVVTEMPPVTVNAEGIVVNVANQVEVTNSEGDPIPVSGNVGITGEITIGNFPNEQAVTIADTVTVSFADEPTVTISNPVTEVTVSGTVDANVEFPASQNVNVENTNLNVTVLNPVESVTVTGSVDIGTLPDIAITNDNLNVTVSNPTESVTILNDNLNVTVSNPTESVTVLNTGFDATILNADLPVTFSNESIEVSNMVDADAIASANNEYIDKTYTIYSNNATFYADAQPPTVDPFGRDGFHYYNNWTTGATTAQKKINWYFYDQTRQTSTYANLQGAWALVTIDRNANRYPFFFVYGTTNGTTISSAWTYYANLNNLVAGQTYLFYFGENPTDVYPDVPRVALPYYPNTSYGTRNPSEFVYSIALTTDSANASGSLEMQVYELGYKANGNSNKVKLEMVNANAQTIIGNVEITNDTGSPIPVQGTVTANVTFPESQTVDGTVTVDTTTPLNVTVSNPTTEVGVNSLPAITIENTGFNVTNQPTVDVASLPNIAITNTGFDATITNENLNVTFSNTSIDANVTFPESQTVDGTVTVSNTGFDVTNTPNVIVANTGDINVNVTNPQTDVNATIVNTTPISVSGSVDVDSLPAITIQNTGFDITNQPTVTVGNASVNVTVDNPTESVTVNNTTDIPVVFSNTSIDIGTVTNLPNVTLTNTGFDVTNQPTVTVDDSTAVKVDIQNADLPVTFSNTTIDVTGEVTANIVGSISNTGFDVTNTPNVIVANTSDINVNVTNPVTNVNAMIMNPEPVPISGSVDIGDLPAITIAENQTVGVTSLPSIEITNTGFEVTNTPTVTVGNASVNVTVDNPTTNVTIDNTDLPVTFSNTTIDVGEITTLPPIAITNTGFNVDNSPTVKISQDGDDNKVDIGTMPNVTVDSLPNITIQNTGFDATITNPNLDVTFSNASIDVGTVTNLPNVKIDSTANSVKITDGTDTLAIDGSGNIGVNVQGTATVGFNNISQPVNLTTNPTITNTGFDVTNSPTIKISQSGDDNKVDIGTMPSVVIDDTTPVDVFVTNALQVEVTPPENQNVTVTNVPTVNISANQNVGISTSANTVKLDTSNNTVKIDSSNNTVGISATANTVKVDDTTPINISTGLTGQPIRIYSTNGGNEANVTVANALKVDGSAVTQPVSGTIDIGNTPTVNIASGQNVGLSTSANTIKIDQTSTNNNVKIANAVDSPVPATITNTPNVAVTSMPTTNVTVLGTPEVIASISASGNTVKIDSNTNTVKVVSSSGQSSIPVSVQGVANVTVTGTASTSLEYKNDVRTKTFLTEVVANIAESILAPTLLTKKLKIYRISLSIVNGAASNHSVIFQGDVGTFGDIFLTRIPASANTAEREIIFQDGIELDAGQQLYILSTVLYSGRFLGGTVVYREV